MKLMKHSEKSLKCKVSTTGYKLSRLKKNLNPFRTCILSTCSVLGAVSDTESTKMRKATPVLTGLPKEVNREI